MGFGQGLGEGSSEQEGRGADELELFELREVEWELIVRKVAINGERIKMSESLEEILEARVGIRDREKDTGLHVGLEPRICQKGEVEVADASEDLCDEL